MVSALKQVPVTPFQGVSMFECFECGKEMEEKEGYLSDGNHICDDCAYELRVSEKPSAYYFDEDNEKFDNMAKENFVAKEHIDDDYSNYYTKKALCFTCGEVNYAEPVHETADRTRMICCDCVEIINCCSECNTLTRENHYDNLCFECKFKKPLRDQMPLEAHLLRIIDIQRLHKNHFDVLADYAELCEFTIFDAYRYKSRCHYYDCQQQVWAGAWDAEQTLQFCCKRHKEYAEDLGCHCQYVYHETDYDEDYEHATCKVCNSPHENNVADRIALRETASGVKPIVSAICMFKELYMSNVLAESLIDLCEYFQ